MSVQSKPNCRLRSALLLLVGGLASIGFVGCEVPVPPLGHASEGAPPEPKYVDPDSKDGRELQEAIKQLRASGAGESSSVAAATGAADGDTRSIVNSRANEPLGFITTPINAYFSAGEKINHIQILDGLKKFRALKGRRPRDFAEVDAEVLKPRAIRLPTLKVGESYVYDPDEGPDGDIMVKTTGSAPAAKPDAATTATTKPAPSEKAGGWTNIDKWMWTQNSALEGQLDAAQKIGESTYEVCVPKGYEETPNPEAGEGPGVSKIWQGPVRTDETRLSLTVMVIPVAAGEEKDPEKVLQGAILDGLRRHMDINSVTKPTYGRSNGIRFGLVFIDAAKDGAPLGGFVCYGFDGDTFLAFSAFDKLSVAKNSTRIANASFLTFRNVDGEN